MCGIIAYIGNREAKSILIEGLKRLEYRGYDSAGVALIEPSGDMQRARSVGRVQGLEELVGEGFNGSVGIAHTRWATHGGVSEPNAHPHVDDSTLGHGVTLVHNGIIENAAELRATLAIDGETFASVPSFSCPDLEYWAERSVDLIDAAYEAGVQHVILHSSLGASGERLSPLQLGRMGGQAHVALRCRVEEHLKACVARSREDPTRPPMMHTILQAAPYANREQLDERRQQQQQQQGAMCERDDADEGARAADVRLTRGSAAVTLELEVDSAPLTSPATLARAAVSAALYTRPNTLRRLVTRQVITTV